MNNLVSRVPAYFWNTVKTSFKEKRAPFREVKTDLEDGIWLFLSDILKYSPKIDFSSDAHSIYRNLLKIYYDFSKKNGLPFFKIRSASIKGEDARFLYNLIKETKPEKVIQIGTFTGFSSLIIASALESNKNGRLITIDPNMSYILEKPVNIAREIAKSLNLDSRIEFTEGFFSSVTNNTWNALLIGQKVLRQIGSIDCAFIDGDHRFESVLSDFELTFRYLKPSGKVLFHDIKNFVGIRRAIDLIVENYKGIHYEAFLKGMDGLGIITKAL